MKVIKNSILILFLALVCNKLSAQQTVSASGAMLEGSDGRVCYSIGQVFYTTNSSNYGSVALGVQHPFLHCLGDADLNGVVNILDYLSVSSFFGCSTNCYGKGDANFDGVINIVDLLIVSSYFGVVCP